MSAIVQPTDPESAPAPAPKRASSPRRKRKASKPKSRKKTGRKGFALGVPRSSRKKRDPLELYETPEPYTLALLHNERPRGLIWEPCCGRGMIARVLERAGLGFVATDIVDRGYGRGGVDVFAMDAAPVGCDLIITNPPYGRGDEFIRHALKLAPRVIVLLRWQYAEGTNKSDIVDGHLDHVWLGRERGPMMHRDEYQGPKLDEAGTPFGWFVFNRVKQLPHGTFTTKRINWSDGADLVAPRAAASPQLDIADYLNATTPEPVAA